VPYILTSIAADLFHPSKARQSICFLSLAGRERQFAPANTFVAFETPETVRTEQQRLAPLALAGSDLAALEGIFRASYRLLLCHARLMKRIC
jgi:hypothetical protein